MSTIAQIEQLSNNNVAFLDSTGATIQTFLPSTRWTLNGTNITTSDKSLSPFNINIFSPITIALTYADGSTGTFTGNAKDLYNLFYTDFFFDVDLSSFVNGAENGTYISGGKVRMGTNPLIEDTTINEQDFTFLQARTSIVNGSDVIVAHLTELSNPFDLGKGLTRGFGLNSDTGNSFVGVWSNNLAESEAFLSSIAGDLTSRIRVKSSGFLLQALNAEINDGEIIGGNGILLFTAPVRATISTAALTLTTPKVEQTITGKYVWGESNTNGSYQSGVESSAFVVQRLVSSIWRTLFSATDTVFTVGIASRFNTNVVEQQITGKYIWGANTTDNSYQAGVESSAFVVQRRLAGVWSTIFSATNTVFTVGVASRFNTDIVEQQITGKYIWGADTTDGSYRIGVESGAFVIQKRIATVWTTLASFNNDKNIPFIFDLSGVTSQIVLSIPLQLGTQYAYNITANMKKTGLTPGANVIVTGGASRTQIGSGGVSSLHSAAPNTQIQETLVGTITFSQAIVSNVLEIRALQSDAVKTRIQGFLEILITQIPDTF